MIKDIWVETDLSSNYDKNNTNSDVIVEFQNGKKYIATFFTYNNLIELINKNKLTGECLNGKYFWASSMIFVDEISKINLTMIIEKLIDNLEFYDVFKEICD